MGHNPRRVALCWARDLDELCRFHIPDGYEDARQQRAKIAHAISDTRHEHHADSDSLQILLMPKSLVCGYDNLEAAIDRCPEQNTISKSQPPLRSHRRDVVILDF